MARNDEYSATANLPPLEPTSKIRAGADGLWSFLVRWQHFTSWMPLALAMAILGFVFFGALDRTVRADFLPTAAMLPLKLLYCFSALGALYVFRRRSRVKLDDEQQREYWRLIMEHPWGPVIVYVTENVVTLCGLYFLLRFFLLA